MSDLGALLMAALQTERLELLEAFTRQACAAAEAGDLSVESQKNLVLTLKTLATEVMNQRRVARVQAELRTRLHQGLRGLFIHLDIGKEADDRLLNDRLPETWSVDGFIREIRDSLRSQGESEDEG